MVVVGGWINPLQPLPQGQVLTFDVDPDPELDKRKLRRANQNSVRVFTFRMLIIPCTAGGITVARP